MHIASPKISYSKFLEGAIHKGRPQIFAYPPLPPCPHVSEFSDPSPLPDVRILLKDHHHSIIIIIVNFCYHIVIDRIICSDLFSDLYSDL